MHGNNVESADLLQATKMIFSRVIFYCFTFIGEIITIISLKFVG